MTEALVENSPCKVPFTGGIDRVRATPTYHAALAVVATLGVPLPVARGLG